MRYKKQSTPVDQRIGSRVNATKNAHTVLHGAEEFDGNVKWNVLARTHAGETLTGVGGK